MTGRAVCKLDNVDRKIDALDRELETTSEMIVARLERIERRMLTRPQLYRSIRIQAALTTGIVVMVLALSLFGGQP